MTDLNLRGIDEEVVKSLKREAVERGVSMKEVAVERLRGCSPKESDGGGSNKSNVPRVRAVRPAEGREPDAAKPVARDAHRMACAECGHRKHKHGGHNGCCQEERCMCGGFK